MSKSPKKSIASLSSAVSPGSLQERDSSTDVNKPMRVGELAKAVGKTVRAMHLYEELGLLDPDSRSDGGFRLYGSAAVERIQWIVKLQAIGFTLGEIQGFVRDFKGAHSGREATQQVRVTFAEKLTATRQQIVQLQVIENDLLEAIGYLDSCQGCSTDFTPSECHSCDHHGHHKGDAPNLFAGLSVGSPRSATRPEPPTATSVDVPLKALYREGNN
jgi:MerR family transcriptional regulator, copper efflux regulator